MTILILRHTLPIKLKRLSNVSLSSIDQELFSKPNKKDKIRLDVIYYYQKIIKHEQKLSEPASPIHY